MIYNQEYVDHFIGEEVNPRKVIKANQVLKRVVTKMMDDQVEPGKNQTYKKVQQNIESKRKAQKKEFLNKLQQNQKMNDAKLIVKKQKQTNIRNNLDDNKNDKRTVDSKQS